jgi:hypothetical protein
LLLFLLLARTAMIGFINSRQIPSLTEMAGIALIYCRHRVSSADQS